MELSLDIKSLDRNISSEILGSDSISTDTEVRIAEGVSIRFDGEGFTKVVGAPIDASFIISCAPGIAAGIASGVISNWLYDKLKGKRIQKVTIESTEVNFNDQGQIEKIVKEKIRGENY